MGLACPEPPRHGFWGLRAPPDTASPAVSTERRSCGSPQTPHDPPMTLTDVTAVIVPHGKVLDFIDGTLRKETPEEYVRQEIEKSLVREYEYSRDQIKVEFKIKMGVASKRCDIAIFPDDAQPSQQNVWIICECKAEAISPDNRTDGVEQLRSYMAASPNAEFGMWTNGKERYCFRPVLAGGKWTFVDVADIPIKGHSADEVEKPAAWTSRTGDTAPPTSSSLTSAFPVMAGWLTCWPRPPHQCPGSPP